MFKNRVLRRIFGHKRAVVTRLAKKIRNRNFIISADHQELLEK
jgi:hypothetical protein